MRLPLVAALLVAGLPLACAEPPTAPPHIVLIVADTLRADHLGCHGYRLDTSPAIDRFSGERGEDSVLAPLALQSSRPPEP